ALEERRTSALSSGAETSCERPSSWVRAKNKQRRNRIMRRQIMRLTSALVLIAAPLSGHALAQGTSSSGSATNFIAQQPANEWLTRAFIGHAVHNTAGEVVGNVNDLVFDRQGRISAVVLGV